MKTETHTMAGMHAAGVACLGAVAGACHPAAALATYGDHQSASWTQGAIAKPATFMVFDRKNRPTRPLSECSP